MTGVADPVVLLVAHGERREGATNAGVWRLVEELRGAGVASEVGAAFLSGEPPVAQALAVHRDRRVLLYPLFLSDGYFSQVRLPELLEAAPKGRGSVETMPPLGLDPALTDLVRGIARRGAEQSGFAPRNSALMLLAHGSTKDAASRNATLALRDRIAGQGVFGKVLAAFLDEPPTLSEALSGHAGAAVVVGLFVGDGLHGGGDAPRLVAEMRSPQVVFAGNIGGDRGLAPLIATSVRERLARVSPSTEPRAAV